MSSGATAWGQSARRSVSQAAPSVESACGAGTPSTSGSCCSRMMTPIPKVNPSTTGSGINSTMRPRPVSPMITTSTPASTPSSGRDASPCCAMTGSSTTVIAPVGPETCRWLPPKIAATRPATMAVISPAAAPAPDATPKPNASGRATTPTVTPAIRSRAHDRRTSR